MAKRTPEEIRAAAAERKARKENEKPDAAAITAVAISDDQKAELLAELDKVPKAGSIVVEQSVLTEVDLSRLVEHNASLSFGIGRDANSQPCALLTWKSDNPPITVAHPVSRPDLDLASAFVSSLGEFFAELEAYLSRRADPRRLPRAVCRTYPDPEREEAERSPAYPSNLSRALQNPDDPTHPSNIRTGSSFSQPITGVPLSNRDRKPATPSEA